MFNLLESIGIFDVMRCQRHLRIPGHVNLDTGTDIILKYQLQTHFYGFKFIGVLPLIGYLICSD